MIIAAVSLLPSLQSGTGVLGDDVAVQSGTDVLGDDVIIIYKMAAY